VESSHDRLESDARAAHPKETVVAGYQGNWSMVMSINMTFLF
jgi:hypothetical protein